MSNGWNGKWCQVDCGRDAGVVTVPRARRVRRIAGMVGGWVSIAGIVAFMWFAAVVGVTPDIWWAAVFTFIVAVLVSAWLFGGTNR